MSIRLALLARPCREFAERRRRRLSIALARLHEITLSRSHRSDVAIPTSLEHLSARIRLYCALGRTNTALAQGLPTVGTGATADPWAKLTNLWLDRGEKLRVYQSLARCSAMTVSGVRRAGYQNRLNEPSLLNARDALQNPTYETGTGGIKREDRRRRHFLTKDHLQRDRGYVGDAPICSATRRGWHGLDRLNYVGRSYRTGNSLARVGKTPGKMLQKKGGTVDTGMHACRQATGPAGAIPHAGTPSANAPTDVPPSGAGGTACASTYTATKISVDGRVHYAYGPRRMCGKGRQLVKPAHRNLTIWGGRKHQILFRGLWFRLLEIDVGLADQTSVRQAAAIAHSAPARRQPIDHVTGCDFNEDRLLNVLKARLPNIVVRSRVLTIHRRPLIPNTRKGRVNLPPPALSAMRTRPDAVLYAPRTAFSTAPDIISELSATQDTVAKVAV